MVQIATLSSRFMSVKICTCGGYLKILITLFEYVGEDRDRL
jgi:hypothetical protein